MITSGIEGNDLCVAANGNLYVTEPNQKRVWLVTRPARSGSWTRASPFPTASGSPRPKPALRGRHPGTVRGSFQVQDDGSLAYKQRYYHLHLVDGSTQSGADGMTLDRDGRLYVATELGVQFCDQAGRVNGILSKPQSAWLSNAVIGGPDFDTLYVTSSDKVYKRPLRTRASSRANPDQACRPAALNSPSFVVRPSGCPRSPLMRATGPRPRFRRRFASPTPGQAEACTTNECSSCGRSAAALDPRPTRQTRAGLPTTSRLRESGSSTSALQMLLLATAIFAAGCHRAPQPDRLQRTGPRSRYTNQHAAGGPWSIHVVRVDRSHPELRFTTAHARNGALGLDTPQPPGGRRTRKPANPSPP